MEYTIALLSDIHGNFEALKACITYIRSQKTDKVVILGDMITDGPCPEKTMNMIYELMKEYDTCVIRGNREEYLLKNYNDLKNHVINEIPYKKGASASGSLLYTYERLREEDYSFFNSIPNVRSLEIEGLPAITVMHGSQYDVRDNYMEEPEKGLYSMETADTPILFGGHSHHQELKKHAGKFYVNPGSVGFAIDGVGKRAQMAFLTFSDECCHSFSENVCQRSAYQKNISEMDISSTESIQNCFSTNETALKWPASVNYDYFRINEPEAVHSKNQKGCQFVRVEFLSLPYDFDSYKKAMLNSHLPEYSNVQPLFCLLSLEYGINYFFKGTNEIIKQSGETPTNASEEVWQRAYELFEKQSKTLQYSNKKIAERYVKYPIEAVVFDMDGVLFDTENLIVQSWEKVSAKHNIQGMREVFYKCIGVNLEGTLKIIREHYGEDFPYETFREEARAHTRAYIAQNGLPVKPYVKETLQYLKDHKVPVGLASSTEKKKILQELEDTGLLEFFTFIIGGDECKKSKPEPDIYLKACEGLGVNPSHCIAIEDSHNGIRAAYQAGMMPVMIPDLLPENDEMREKTLTILESLEHIPALLEIKCK